MVQRNTTIINTSPSGSSSFWNGAWRFIINAVGWIFVIVTLIATIRILAFKSIFGTTSGFLTAELGLSDYAALPVATLLSIGVTALFAPLFTYFVLGRRPFRAFMAMLILAVGAGALGLFSENLIPERVYMCNPDEIQFFTRKGSSRIFYARVGQQVQFFNRPGFHPQRGTELQSVTPIIAGQLLDAFQAGQHNEYQRECEQQRRAGQHQRELAQLSSGQSAGAQLLDWMGLRSPIANGYTGYAGSGSSNYSGNTISTDQPNSNAASPDLFSNYISIAPGSSEITAIDIEGEQEELAKHFVKRQFVNGDLRAFNRRFKTDGLFSRAIAGDANVISSLKFPGNVHEIVLVRTRVNRTENREHLGVLKVTFTLAVTIITPSTGSISERREVSIHGAGFSEEAAWLQIRERLNESEGH